jgi:hypothetical protein
VQNECTWRFEGAGPFRNKVLLCARVARCSTRSGLRCLVLAFVALTSAGAVEKPADLPDWSGWWVLAERINDEWDHSPPPLKPADLARYRAARREDADPDPGRFCRPPQFTGYSGGFTEAVELLFTPGRVTLINEMGLVRRIYTDGRTFPGTLESSNTGLSIGRWEGQTLVVETKGILPSALYPLHTTHGAMPIGSNATITERISLQTPDRLQFEVFTVAPDLLLAPDKRQRLYSRARNKTAAREFNLCVDHDRSIDPDTGKQRFDLTPPPDLAPPPPKKP